MKPALVAALAFAATASAQTHHPVQHHPHASSGTFTDPANLRGERVTPRTGRELPIDSPEAQGGHGLEQMLRRLNTRASLMLIVAHPDDEDGGMLTLYSRGLGARVATLTLTRGEGGQNAMTGDFEDALGLIRTQELLSADRYFGVDQMFGTEVDFGFSKTKEEAFAKWTHQRVLYDAVRAVRLYRPLVIAAVFNGSVTDGHGQHQVSGEIAQEVFKAAADPKVFPELTAEGILPWQPLKVYARIPGYAITEKGLFDYATNQYAPARFTNYVTGEITTTAPTTDVVVHEGQTDPLLSDTGAQNAAARPSVSYVQFARMGLGLQKTQIGPGVRTAPAGVMDIAYHRYGSRLGKQPAHEESFFDGIDTTLAGMATLASTEPGFLRDALRKITEEIRAANAAFTPAEPQKIAPQLAQALHATDEAMAALQPSALSPQEKSNILHELRIKRVQLNNALALALGIAADATLDAKSPELPVDHSATVTVRLSSSTPAPVSYNTLSIANAAGDENQIITQDDSTANVSAGKPAEETLDVDADMTTAPSRPYFSRPDIEQPFYNVRAPDLRNAPTGVPTLTAWVDLDYQGTKFRVGRVVHAGDQPIRFVPELSVALGLHAQVLANDLASVAVPISVTTAGSIVRSEHLEAPAGWHVTREDTTTAHANTAFRVEAPAKIRQIATLHGSATAGDGRTYTDGYSVIGYGDLPRTNFFTPATDRIVPVDLKLPSRRRIGYLPGTGDAVPEALASIGLPLTQLTVADLTTAKLAGFDTVVLGVRTYNAHPDLHGAPTEALLAFARNGGNVILQYQTYEFAAADAPFALTLGNAEKVVDETAPVQLLQPASPLLSSPNRLSPADFNGWIEERGHGFLDTWDGHYTALTETHDPGQAPQQGGLITTQFGRGHWTYCAFAVYRQLPEAVPGAFRLLTNLLGLADQPTP